MQVAIIITQLSYTGGSSSPRWCHICYWSYLHQLRQHKSAINPIEIPWFLLLKPSCFPMVFSWFSYGFPIVFPWFSYVWFSHDFPMVFPLNHHPSNPFPSPAEPQQPPVRPAQHDCIARSKVFQQGPGAEGRTCLGPDQPGGPRGEKCGPSDHLELGWFWWEILRNLRAFVDFLVQSFGVDVGNSETKKTPWFNTSIGPESGCAPVFLVGIPGGKFGSVHWWATYVHHHFGDACITHKNKTKHDTTWWNWGIFT